MKDLRYHSIQHDSVKMLIRQPALVVQAKHLYYWLHINETGFLMTWLIHNSHWLEILFHIGLF